ncbi:MAG TPA: DUF6055 domain-containing protein, partial [Sunxiuqinia sp.]|nr:DUF6055 domain-containing protein [Sunxiuqinia sp.]
MRKRKLKSYKSSEVRILLLAIGIFVSMAVSAQDATTGLILHYSFENLNGMTIVDESGNNNSGTLKGDATSTTGFEGQGVVCTNKGDYIEAPDDITVGMNSFTFACWVKFSSLKNATRFFDWGNGNDGTNNFLSFVPSFGGDNTFMVLRFRPSSGTAYNVTSTQTCPIGTWVHIAVTYAWNGTSGTGTIYLNGEAVGATSGIPYNPSSFLGSTNDNFFGYSRWSADTNGFDGTFDEIRVFNRALTADDIDELVFDVTQLKTNLHTLIEKANAIPNPTPELTDAIAAAQQTLEEATTSTELKQGIEDLKAAIDKYKLDAASAENPLDVTAQIVNPSFESSLEGWTNNGMETQTNSFFPGRQGSTYIEKWVNRGSAVPDVGVQQKLTGLANGNYILTAAAGNIQQTGSGSSINLGNPQKGVSLFAGLRNTAVDTVKTRQVRFTVVDHEVTIGLKAENATGNWITCDNFHLQYVGQYQVEDYALYVNDVVEEAKKLLTQKIQVSAEENLNAAIDSAEEAVNATPLDSARIAKSKASLDHSVSIANSSIKAYAELQAAIDYANKVLGWYDDDQVKKDRLQPAIDTAREAVNNLDQTLAEINAATADLNAVVNSVDKKVHIPTWMMGDVNNPENDWSYERSKKSKDWILFWEPGFGSELEPIVDSSLELAEKCFEFYADSLHFITKGSSKTDTYRMIIRLRNTTEWEATGSGVDNFIGLLTLTPWALQSRGGQTIAHEVGHCFQYQVHCDNNDTNGWMYGYGTNASGKNGWWEQCAQWQAFKVFPSMQFSNEWFSSYMNDANKNILHESPRYENFFIQDYWCYLHGLDIIGRLWNESKKPEDPVEAYKRITGIFQARFNDEMYDCAARFATWDIPALRSYGASKINSRPQPKMNDAGNDFWMIDPSVCPENYGHNIIKLN